MKQFTISIFTENFIGLLNRVCIVFTRRHLNIDSITASESEIKNVYRYTIVLKSSEEQVKKVVAQLDKIVDVLKAFYHEEDQTIHQEIALYKISTDSFYTHNIEKIIHENHAKILSFTPEYVVIEKTGDYSATQSFFEALKPFEIHEFARSGSVSVTKPMKLLAAYLEDNTLLN